jgi:hypothetical protein
VDATHSHRLSRLSKLLLAGIGVAFTWVLLSFALGFSAAQAHADDGGGLLGAVSSTVDDTTSTVTGVVEETTSATAQTVTPTVETVTPVVDPIVPVAPVVEAVEATVAPVVDTVADAAASGVVAPIVDSAVAVVGAVPVVGDVVSSLGADDAVSSVGSSVDGVLQGTTGAAAGAVTDVVDSTTGGTVTAPVVGPVTIVDELLIDPALTTRADAVTAPAANPFETVLRAAYMTGAAAWASLTSDSPAAAASADSAALTGGALGVTLALLRSVLQADSVLTGSAGAGPGAWVLVALGFVVAYRAWMRRTGLENDTAPPAPAYSTDVSPD